MNIFYPKEVNYIKKSENTLFCIVGGSGAGKSALLNELITRKSMIYSDVSYLRNPKSFLSCITMCIDAIIKKELEIDYLLLDIAVLPPAEFNTLYEVYLSPNQKIFRKLKCKLVITMYPIDNELNKIKNLYEIINLPDISSINK